MIKRITAAILLCVMVFVPYIEAQELNQGDLFKLWNNCRPMDLVVEELSEDAMHIGLTKEMITTTARSRLRAARLFSTDKDFPYYLYVNVHVAGRAYNIHIRYGKVLDDPVSGVRGLASTWDAGSSGEHGGNRAHILFWTSSYVDQFIDEYLLVNDMACRGETMQPDESTDRISLDYYR